MDASLSQSGSAPARVSVQDVPESVQQMDLTVSGPGMDAIERRLTRETDAVVIEVPVGPDRVFELEAGIYDGRVVQSVGAGGTQVSIPLLSDLILFSANWDGDYELYQVRVGSPGQIMKLTDNAVADHKGKYINNGTQIVFERRDPGGPELYRMEIDGSNVTQLTGTTAGTDLFDAFSERFWQISPDYGTVAYYVDNGTSSAVYTAPTSGAGDPSLLKSNAASTSTGLMEPIRWSPNSQSVLVVNGNTSPYDVSAIDVDTGNEDILASAPFVSFADWLPGGQRIVYLQEDSGTYQIRTVSTNLSSPQPQVIDSVDEFFSVSGISPDRRTIAYALPAGGFNEDLYTAQTDGSGSPQLVFSDTDTYTGSLAFSPDSELIAVTRGSGDTLAVVGARGGLVEIVGDRNDSTIGVWAPDSSALAFVESIPLSGESEADILHIADLSGEYGGDRQLVEQREGSYGIDWVDWGP
jgi:Tol biopolymer transport system component